MRSYARQWIAGTGLTALVLAVSMVLWQTPAAVRSAPLAQATGTPIIADTTGANRFDASVVLGVVATPGAAGTPGVYQPVNTDGSGRLQTAAGGASTTVLGAGEAFIGKVGGSTLHPSQNPTLSVAATYVSGDYVGTSSTPWTWTACRTAGGTGMLQSVTVVDKTAGAVAGEVWLFDRSVTVPLDSAAWTVTDADAQFLLGVVSTGTYFASAANSIASKTAVGLPIWCNSGTSIFGAFVTRGAPTYASGDLTIILGVVTD